MSTPATYSRKNPFPARLLRAEVLTKPGSSKDTRHFEIDLSGSGIQYEPGDSLAVQPLNDPALAAEVIDVLGLKGDEIVGEPGAETTLLEALIKDYSITQPDPKLLKAIAAMSAGSAFGHLLDADRKHDLANYLWGREVIDLLMEHPEAKFTAQEFVKLLRKLQVRLYSISSSLKAVPEQVHLTVATVQYDTFGRKRQGVASSWLAYRLEEETVIPCFITPNNKFRLPAPENDVPIIMVGPGTGVAPFRAFVQERGATGAKGDAWLFFGEQHQKSEFFYEEEWEAALKGGALTKITTAFSRDQAHKIYVQHRMLEEGAEFWKWLERGAVFYVCGDKTRMAADVDAALHEIVHRFGGKSMEEATEYVEQMKKEHRYHRDVY
jgi:sulfite reductase (NADPH) flavoprotein alpha-component